MPGGGLPVHPASFILYPLSFILSFYPSSFLFCSAMDSPSILDNDLYKFTMQQAVLELYPRARANYQFIDRRPAERFTPELLRALEQAIAEMPRLCLQPAEQKFLQARCPYLKPAYLDYLQDYRYQPEEVETRLDRRGRLAITISGPWQRAILWEVPLLAIVSRLHGLLIQRGWSHRGQAQKLQHKSAVLRRAGCRFADFGTRRRRDFAAQDRVVKLLRGNPGFLGTSNVYLAQRYDVPPIGTMAHEWIMAHGVLSGLQHANRHALEAWARVYPDRPGTALSDTYTSRVFWEDFDAPLARRYDGVRQDSGCPFAFIEQAIGQYQRLGIDPAEKTIVFSDGLTPELAVRLQQRCGSRASFGIGTNLTNNFSGSEAPSIVIKLAAIDGRPAVKLTDDPAKASGDPEALRLARQVLC
jgi:nicotinate phosphoribosyltransferase